ncbi:MAG: ABC transporter substrate-binding protein [Phycisphaerales bacterium]
MRFLDGPKIGILLGLLVVLGVPFAFRPDDARPGDDADLSLVIISPHNEQIRYEFSRAFDDWHREHYGQSVKLDWRVPGGTSEIRKQVFAEYEAAIRRGPIEPGSMSYDLLFGGGSYEHGQMKREVSAIGEDGVERSATIAVPIDFTDEQLAAWYGDNRIGRNTLYDPDRYWFGTALSAFGVVYNRDVLERLRVPEPRTWADLTNPRLAGWIALADPGQSGSICTTFEVILNLKGWSEGWAILREAAANSRYFSNSSSKVPIDVSLGEAAAGMCIDFYGRSQAQSIADAGDPDRLGFIAPVGVTDIDPDPVTMLRGGPNPELARRFVEFTLTPEAQALWQFPARGDDASGDGLGPVRFELRRLPIRPDFYGAYAERLIDKVNPFDTAQPIEAWNFDIRRNIAPLFSAMAIDNHRPLEEAWVAMNAAGPEHPDWVEMRRLFHAMPVIVLQGEDDDPSNDRTISLDSTEGLADLKERWGGPSGAQLKELDRIRWTEFFRENYRAIIELAEADGN